MPLPITALPAAPTRADPANFNTRAEAFVAALLGLVSEINNLGAADWFQVLGTVSETGGVPTGTLFEAGSNANGEYVRFADGTQICTGSFTLTGIACSTAYAGGYRNASASNVTFPAAFSAVPAVHHAPSSLAASDAMSLGHGGISALVFSPRIWRTDVGTVNYEAKFTAIGRWFN